MKSSRSATALALIFLAVLVAPLSASEPAVYTAPNAGLFYPTATLTAGGLCPTYHCPIYYPDDWDMGQERARRETAPGPFGLLLIAGEGVDVAAESDRRRVVVHPVGV